MTKKNSLVIVGAALLSLAAYVSASYLLSPAVIDSGGGAATSPNYELECSIGGPVVATTTAGTASSPNYTLDGNITSVMETVDPPPPAGDDDDGGGCVPSDGPGTLVPLLFVLFGVFLRRPRASYCRYR